MWLVVYKDTHQDSYRTSKFFECEDDAWSHYDRLSDMNSVDPAMGIRPIGVGEINLPGQLKMRE